MIVERKKTGLNYPRVLLVLCVVFFHVLVLTGCRGAFVDGVSENIVETPVAVPLVNNFDSHTLRIAVGEWPPYTGEGLPHYGCDAWVVTEAFESQGLSVTYGFFPWARSYLFSASGEWDGTMEWDNTPDYRKEHYLSSEYLSEQEWVFFYRTDRPFDWQTLSDLQGKRIGVTSGYVYSEAFNQMIADDSYQFEEASSDKANLQKLLLGRIDIFPLERQVGYAILQNDFSAEEGAQITDHPQPLHAFRPYLLLTRANPENEERVQLFDQGFQLLKQSGRYDEIMKACLPKQ